MGSLQPRAVLLSRHHLTCRRASQALVAAGLEVLTANSLDRPIVASGVRLALVDLDLAPEQEAAALLAQARAVLPEVPLCVTAGVAAEPRILSVLGEPGVRHAIPKRGTGRVALPPGVETLGNTAWPDEHALFTAARCALGAPPDLDGVLRPGTVIHETSLQGSDQRASAVAQLNDFLERMALARDTRSRFELIVDELLMNAFYDAPHGADGRPRFADLERSRRVTLEPGELVHLRWASDAQLLGVSVRDPFGALEQRHVAQRLGLVGSEDLGPRPGSGGAGLGLIMAYAAANQLIFRVVPGRVTEVTALVRIAGTQREAQEHGTSVHFYRGEGGGTGW